jgi:hypothetical protein
MSDSNTIFACLVWHPLRARLNLRKKIIVPFLFVMCNAPSRGLEEEEFGKTLENAAVQRRRANISAVQMVRRRAGYSNCENGTTLFAVLCGTCGPPVQAG